MSDTCHWPTSIINNTENAHKRFQLNQLSFDYRLSPKFPPPLRCSLTHYLHVFFIVMIHFPRCFFLCVCLWIILHWPGSLSSVPLSTIFFGVFHCAFRFVCSPLLFIVDFLNVYLYMIYLYIYIFIYIYVNEWLYLQILFQNLIQGNGWTFKQWILISMLSLMLLQFTLILL